MQYGQLIRDIKSSPYSKQPGIKKYAFVKIDSLPNGHFTIKELGGSEAIRVSPTSYKIYIKELSLDQIKILGLLHE